MIASMRDTNITYIGHTSDVRRRLSNHNSALGGSQGTDAKRENGPYIMVAMISGFSDRYLAARFEGIWKADIAYTQRVHAGQYTIKDKISIGRELLSKEQNNHELTFLLCGRFEKR
jgi:predicted GIY-YIG superfamily endonuclease